MYVKWNWFPFIKKTTCTIWSWIQQFLCFNYHNNIRGKALSFDMIFSKSWLFCEISPTTYIHTTNKQSFETQLLSQPQLKIKPTSIIILSSLSVFVSICLVSRNFLKVSSVTTCVFTLCMLEWPPSSDVYPKFLMIELKSFFWELLFWDNSKSKELFLVSNPVILKYFY